LDFSDAHQADRRSEAGSPPTRGETARLDADQLGPYALIAEISSGDFTTVHLAHKQGAHGFDRLVAIKRLKPAFARQPEWSQLLLDEARLGASVDHPNTVDILDVGTDAGVYVVMDYVEGADLEQLLARAGRERHPRYVLPPVIDALTGLHAIHTQRDELGEPLGMVHQAPRARHVLVGIHGTSRVTDFSQVTARGLIPSTLRGKGLSPAYMAPEQVLVSEPVSARTDVFILGITLWEALTGERLFVGETPSLVRRAITERDIPKPSEIGLLPPRCFDGIVMRALQRNPELRYQTAAEMARDLREVGQEEALLASASELGQWVRALASRSLLERRRALGVDEPSQEIDIELLERHLAADRARASQVPPEPRESIPFARDSILEPNDEPPLQVHERELSVVPSPEPVAPAITVPVHDGNKREPTQPRRAPTIEPKRPTIEPKRTPTGTLLGVAAKPRSVGLPPPAAAALQAKGGAPQYRGSLGHTQLEAPRIEVKPSAMEAKVQGTLPDGAAFISELSLPIDLPPVRASKPSFVGFHRVIDTDAEAVVTPPRKQNKASWQTATKAGLGTAEFGGAAAPIAAAIADAPASVPPASAPAFVTPPSASPAPRSGAFTAPPAPQPSWPAPAPAWTPPPASAPGWGPSSAAWTTPPATARGPGVIGSLGNTREEKRRHSEPPARHSRPPVQQTLDGNVPRDVFERLRPTAGPESWRPPANAVHQPWLAEEEPEPRRYGRTFALAAAVVVAGFFGYQQLNPSEPALPPPTSVHATGESGVRNFDPMAANREAHQAQAPVVPPPVVPPPAVAPPPAVVPPVSLNSLREEPVRPAPQPRRVVPRTQVRREEPLARPEPFARPAARRPSRAQELPDNPY
jgi:serine/threonine-protein kinase